MIRIAKVVGRPDPYTVVVLEGVTLPAYAAGGVNLSVGELATVDHAQVYFHRTSAGVPPAAVGQVWVSSGSGNVVTVSARTASGTELGAGAAMGGGIYSVLAWGH